MSDYAELLNYGGMYGTPPYHGVVPNAGAVSGSFIHQMKTPITEIKANNLQTPKLTGWQKFGYAMDGLGAIGGLWGAIQENKIAKQQLALSRDAFETNMRNTIQNYNTTLEDRIRARYAMEGRGEADVNSYLDEHSLRRNA